MTPLWTSAAIATAVGGQASGDFSISGLAFDSREVSKGDLFIALKGAETDGHKFLGNAFLQGAGGAISSHPIANQHVLVEDTTSALIMLGAAARKRTNAKIIGVTGSVGKTGTKEALAAALARGTSGAVHRSVKSYNNHTGVPLSLARMPADSAFGVLEMGMNHAGELAALTQLVRPHVALITAVASAHRAYFNSEADIAEAKAEIFQGVAAGGIAIIPRDSDHYAILRDRAAVYATQVISFGQHPDADVRAIDAHPIATGTMVAAQLRNTELHFTLNQPGAHMVSNALAVLACVESLGGDVAAAGLALAELPSLAGRGTQTRIMLSGGGSALLIDESYNANPASMAATLAVLANVSAERRVAVLGEMRELGAESDALHAALADKIIAAKVDFVILVGLAMTPLAEVLDGSAEVVHVTDANAAAELVLQQLTPHTAILVKGSNALGLSRVVNAIVEGSA